VADEIEAEGVRRARARAAAADLVISVCDRAHDVLAERGDLRELHWSVPDPARRNAAAFDRAADAITDRIASLEPWITPV